jgi:lipopolysaccharide transport system ATP-binding protein
MSKVVIRTEKLGKEYRRGSRATNGLLRDALVKRLSSPSNFFRRERVEKFWALRDVSLEVNEGEVIGLIGRNGSGKTTLLKILSRITRPTEGMAEIDGRIGTLLEVGTGFHPELTGRENTFLSAAILGMKKQEIARKFDEIVAFAELEKFIDTPVKHYSTGMAVRLAFAVAAHIEPEILLVDEVLAVGDIKFQQRCLGKMGEVARTGRTIILVSHQLSQIRRLCRLAVWLDQGQVRQAGPTAEIVTAYEAEMSVGGLDNSRPPQGRAQFLSWRLEDSTHSSDHSLASEGPATVSFFLRVNESLNGVHLGALLYDQSRNPLWSRTEEGFSIGRGVHELRYTLSSLPILPGVYTWRVGIYDSGERIDDWECIPQMQVTTVPLNQTRDEIAGILNIPSDMRVRQIEEAGSMRRVSSSEFGGR